jgi:hypothetical protein
VVAAVVVPVVAVVVLLEASMMSLAQDREEESRCAIVAGRGDLLRAVLKPAGGLIWRRE